MKTRAENAKYRGADSRDGGGHTVAAVAERMEYPKEKGPFVLMLSVNIGSGQINFDSGKRPTYPFM